VAFITPLVGDLRGSFGVDQGPPILSWGSFTPWWLPGVPQVYGARPREVSDAPIVPPVDFGIPTLPVEESRPVFYPPPATAVRSVLPGQVGGGGPGVRPPPTRTRDVTGTEVESYEQGDFPVGSIFAPGRTWGPDPIGEFDEKPEEEVPVWTDIISGVVDVFQGQQFGGYNIQPPGYFPGLTTGPGPTQIPGGSAATPPGGWPVTADGTANCGNRRYVTLDRETGKISCKRRRRRRLLTNRDLADLASLKTITGGGAALNAAVIRAVR